MANVTFAEQAAPVAVDDPKRLAIRDELKHAYYERKTLPKRSTLSAQRPQQEVKRDQ